MLVKNLIPITYHLIFVLDESGRVSSYFKDIVNCTKKLINAVKDPKNQRKDIMSIITFDTDARIRISGAPLDTNFNLDCKGGGTIFEKAFKLLIELMELNKDNQ